MWETVVMKNIKSNKKQKQNQIIINFFFGMF